MKVSLKFFQYLLWSLCGILLLNVSSNASTKSSAACTAPDNGSGSANLPASCPYTNPSGTIDIIDGLPAGDQINSNGTFDSFFDITYSVGGSLGGAIEQFKGLLTLVMSGTGSLSGFNRTIPMNMQCVTHSAPRTSGNPVQSFDTDMFQLQGQVTGDPDFDLLRITAGTNFGLPSPGHTTLTQLPGGDWNIDSFFDITYRIDFVGTPGGTLAGRSGSTTGTIRMQQGMPVLPEVFFPTDNLPPNGRYENPPENLVHYPNGLIIRNIIHQNLTPSAPPPPVTASQLYTFGGHVSFDLSLDGGVTFVNQVSNGNSVARVIHTSDISPTRFFDTEMLALDITGGSLPAGVMIRESPTLASLGKTTIRTDVGGYMIGSFFDIFTELSIDGGQNWIPAQDSAHMILVSQKVPPPTTGRICVYKYFDRNHNQQLDPGEQPIPNVQFYISDNTVTYNGITDVNGLVCFDTLQPGEYVLRETIPDGYSLSVPKAGFMTFQVQVGLDTTVVWMNGAASDTVLYRTAVMQEWATALDNKGKTNPVKCKRGIALAMPNLHNVGMDLQTQNQLPITIGSPSGGHSVIHKKYKDVQKTFYGNKVLHSNTPRCLDTFDKSRKQILKQQKSLPAKKHNNILLAEALALKLNILASDRLKFPYGLGELIYDNSKLKGFPGPFDGKTVRQIMAQVDTFLSCAFNPKSADSSEYLKVVQLINQAFAGPVDTISWGCTKLVLTGVKSLKDVPYLRANPGAVTPIEVPVIPATESVPDIFTLYQNYPNPFNPTTTIQFDLPEPAIVTLKIYNMLGQEVATLMDREEVDVGAQSVDFDADALSSGIYFYQLMVNEITDEDEEILGNTFSSVRKMMVIK